MKILFVTHKFPPSTGGMEMQCFELYNGIKADNEIILMKMPDNANRIWWLFTLGSRVRKALKKDPSITHVYFNDALCGMAAAAVRTCSNAKTVVTVHGLDAVFPNAWFQRRFAWNLTNNIDAAIAVSTATADEIRKRGVPAGKVFTVANGVDLTLADIPADKDVVKALESKLGFRLSEKKVIVSIGRSVRRKGFSWFINNVVPRLDKDIVYVIIGPRQEDIRRINFYLSLLPKSWAYQISLMGVGVDAVDIDKALVREDVKGKAYHLGKASFPELVQLLKHSYAFVMPNIRIHGDAEGFGLVALEAVMNGTVAVVAGIEGITEAIRDGENGIHVESGDADAWVKAIHSLCADPQGRNALAAKGVEYTRKNFSWKKMSDNYIDIFRRLRDQ
jgi:phosphatidylinositol alpha-1,6-mannosyltransferase